jgi:hypothetical protein
MPRIAKAYTDNVPPLNPADDTPDNLPGGQQRVLRTMAELVPKMQLAPGAVRSAFDAGRQAKAASGRSGRSRRLPPLDGANLQVHQQLAPPQPPQKRGQSKYDSVFTQLTADGMAVTGIHRSYQGGISKACSTVQARLPKGSKLVVRVLADGTIGVFRVRVAA